MWRGQNDRWRLLALLAIGGEKFIGAAMAIGDQEPLPPGATFRFVQRPSAQVYGLDERLPETVASSGLALSGSEAVVGSGTLSRRRAFLRALRTLSRLCPKAIRSSARCTNPSAMRSLAGFGSD
jgi:hypothetical protein